MPEIVRLSEDTIPRNLLLNFQHDQIIARKFVKQGDAWIITESSEMRTWDQDKRVWITEYLKQQIGRGGFAAGAFENGVCIGFGSMDGYLRGRTAEYANFTMLFVDDRWKRKGIGSRLFQEIAKCAREKGAKKLFLSAIPAVETIQFYLSLGCVDAEERIESYIDTAEDRCLEYKL